MHNSIANNSIEMMNVYAIASEACKNIPFRIKNTITPTADDSKINIFSLVLFLLP